MSDDALMFDEGSKDMLSSVCSCLSELHWLCCSQCLTAGSCDCASNRFRPCQANCFSGVDSFEPQSSSARRSAEAVQPASKEILEWAHHQHS